MKIDTPRTYFEKLNTVTNTDKPDYDTQFKDYKCIADHYSLIKVLVRKFLEY